MGHCVNISSKEFQDLSKEVNMNPVALAAKVSLWQEENGLDNFPTREDISPTEGEVMLQIESETLPAPKASEATVNTMKQAAEKMGINIMSMVDYAKGNPDMETKDVNGVADLMKKTIAVAEGMENVALTEEVVHIATAMMEQTHPGMITEMISKIDRFKIYKQVFDEYKNLKAYQLSDGKPNIRKIKKEAVDKLIAEVIVHKNDPASNFPDLLQEREMSMVERWWNAIIDKLMGLYRKSNIAVFQKAGEVIASGEVDASVTPKEIGFYYNTTEDNPVNRMFDTIKSHHNDLELVDENKAINVLRHYLYKGKKVAQSVTEKVKSKIGKKFERTEAQKLVDDMKRAWGDEGHKLLERFFSTLIDENGYKRDKPLPDNITSNLPPEVEAAVKGFAIELINSYTVPGTRFVIENKAVNLRAKGMIASTIDFMAIEPVMKDGQMISAKVDVLDWKFTSLEGMDKEDIPWYKKKEWVAQMGEYSQILYNYGLKPSQLRKARMVPFLMRYDNLIADQPQAGIYPRAIEVGNLDPKEESKMYLLPVPIPAESTGNVEVDKLIKSLQNQYEKLYKTPVEPEAKQHKDQRLNEINRAIRNLQLKLNFSPLIEVADNFFRTAAKDIMDIDKKDFSQEEEGTIDVMQKDLITYLNSASKYHNLAAVYNSVHKFADRTEEEKAIAEKLAVISARTKNMVEKIRDIQHRLTLARAEKEGIYVQYEQETIDSAPRISPEVPISSLFRDYEEASKIDASLIQLNAQIMKVASKETNMKYQDKMEDFREILLPLERTASARGTKAFDMIATVTPSALRLHRKYDSKFWDSIKEARSKKDKKYLMQNMDMAKYKELAEKALEKELDYIERATWSSDEEQNAFRKKKAKEEAIKGLVITSEHFNGYDNFNFTKILNQVLKEEGNLSKEYLEMQRTPEAVKVWEYFTELNDRAKALGYLAKNSSSSFFPLIEATILQKASNSGNFFSQLAKSAKELGITSIDENQGLGKIDPETGEYQLEIPKYFTQTDKTMKEMSTDLGKVGAMWIKALLEYEKADSMESTLLTILSVEQSKGGIVTDKRGNIVREGGEIQVREENPNASYMEAQVYDFLYGIREDVGSAWNVRLGKLAGKVSKTEEGKEQLIVNAKKLVKNAEVYTQAMGVGMKPLVTGANVTGANLHAYIKAGTFYDYSDYFKHELRVVKPNSLSTLEKALMLKMIPPGSDLISQEQRKIAKEKGFVDLAATWSFSDVMMATHSFAEHRLQYANSLSFIHNSMIVDGKIVPIKQYLIKQDRAKKYEPGFTEQQRRALEKSLDARVKALTESSSLLKTCSIENGKLVIPGVSDRELAKYATLVTEYGRGITAAMNPDDKAAYKRDTMLNSFFMFKHWIPPMISQRVGEIRKDASTGEWEYGRTRAFIKTWTELGWFPVKRIHAIITGSEEGLRILDQMLQDKKDRYFKDTGKELQITKEEYYDMMRKELNNQWKEIKMLFLLLGGVFAAAMMQPPEDESDLVKNRYKNMYKQISKMAEEITFYYNPVSFEAISRGSILPAVGVLAKIGRFLEAFAAEGIGHAIDDQEMIDKNYPIKYFINLVPGLYQIDTEVMPYVYPEWTKEEGRTISAQTRRH